MKRLLSGMLISYLVLTLFSILMINRSLRRDMDLVNGELASIRRSINFLSSVSFLLDAIKFNSPGSTERFLKNYLESTVFIDGAFIFDSQHIFSVISRDRAKGISASELEHDFRKGKIIPTTEFSQFGTNYLFTTASIQKGFNLALLVNTSKVVSESQFLTKVKISQRQLEFEYSLYTVLKAYSPLLIFFILFGLFIGVFISELLGLFFVLTESIKALGEGRIAFPNTKIRLFPGLRRRIEMATQQYLYAQKAVSEEKHKREGIMGSAREIAHDSCNSWDVTELFVEIADELIYRHGERSSCDLEEYEHAKRAVKVHVLYVKSLMNDLLNLNNERPLLKVKFAPSTIIRDIIDDIRQTVATPISFHVDVPEHTLILADQKIIRVFLNLIRNCVEATGFNGFVYILARDTGSEVRFTIGNTGSYISHDTKQKILSSLYTAGKINGHGLGISIVRKILNEHGRSLEIESDDHKKKTEFYFSIEKYNNQG